MNTYPTEAGTRPMLETISKHDTLIMLMGEEGSGHSDFINIITGRSSSLSHHQSIVEAIRVPGQDHLVLVNTPALTRSLEGPPPELGTISAWLTMMDTLGIRLTGIIYVFSVRSSKSLVNPSVLLDAFQRVANDIILVVNKKDVDLNSAIWVEKEKEIKERFSSLGRIDLPLCQTFDDLASALEITNNLTQDDRVNVKLVLDKTKSGFSLARVDDKWWIIKRRVAQKAIYQANRDPVSVHPRMQATWDIVMNWVLRKTPADAHVMWINGEEKSGKTNFARAIAESCSQNGQNLLLATFFFSQWDPSRNTINSLIPTIVHQVVGANGLLKMLIVDAMGDQSIHWAPFAAQLNQLVLQPIVKLGISDFPSLIIIDGLDKCVHPGMQSEVVEGIVESRKNLKSKEYPLRFLVFSRASKELKEAFRSLVPTFMVYRIALDGRLWRKFAKFSAARAIHSSKERRDPPRCHPQTRVAMKERLMNWGTTGVSPILWFYGAAGTGKSAIAQTLAEILQAQDLLLATFFFSRTDPTRNTIKPLAATIAFQIGTIIPDLRELILEALDNNPRLLNGSFSSQLTNLVLQPLAKFALENPDLHVPQLIIIDGLDECYDQEIQSQLIINFADATMNKKCPLRVLIVSRPEQHLQYTFNTRLPSSGIDRLALDGSCVSDDDIRVFVEAHLGAIQQSHPKCKILKQKWPDPSSIEHLVRRSLGQFVYASTIIKYLSSSEDPPACLDEILQLRCKPEDEGLLSCELDLLYLHILSSVKGQVEVIKMILGVILFVDPEYDFFAPLVSPRPSAAQTLIGIEMLVGLNPGQAMIYISQLHPLIQYSDDGYVFVSHASVAEFLNLFNRSKSFYLDRRYILTNLVGRCFQVIKNGDDDSSIQYAYGRLPQLCTGIPRTTHLLGNLMEFRLSRCYRWCQLNADRVGAALTKEDRILFPWWYVTRFLMILRQLEQAHVYAHQLSAFDKLIYSILSEYHFEDFQLMLAVTSIPTTGMNLTEKKVFILLRCLQVNGATLDFDASIGGLGLLSIYHGGRSDDDCFRIGQHHSRDIVVDVYHQLLSDFFNNPARSGIYSLSSTVFASAALKFRKFICGYKGVTKMTEVDVATIQIAYSFLPYLLPLAGESVDVLSFLQQGK